MTTVGNAPEGSRLGAVVPGTDLSQHARLLSRVHDAVLSGQEPPAQPRTVVARSWSRVAAGGLTPDHCGASAVADFSELESRRSRTALRSVLPELRTTLTEVAEDAGFIVVVADADGVLLWREGAKTVKRAADALGFAEGARWSEQSVGTNAIGTALIEDSAVQLFSAEHYAPTHHNWSCTGSPVHDPRTGEILGVVDISGSAASVHPTTVALVRTAVRLAEATLWREHAATLERLRSRAAPLFAAGAGPALVVDEFGWVAGASGIAAPDRVAAPSAGKPVIVPGLGMCLPEPLGDGWLLRTGVGGPVIELELSLGASPQVTVRGDANWTRALSPRHAQILRALAAVGSAGVDAAGLSEVLCGDREHVVAVRAEVSRLRKHLGAVLQTQPYRFADGVRVVVT
ncbi:GAF domain-containing protein [Rhodococcus erythropolis]|uniref:GAF domain-containing protein n=1 Tax=Rhodococcus baikonurensis TaxID=172041 RepID=UPI00339A8E13